MKITPFALTFIAGSNLLPAVDFVREVQPLLAEHCLECHGPDDSKGGLVLTSRELAIKALKSGAHGIVPGEPDESEMIARLLSTDPDEQMPPPKHREKHPVKSKDIEVLKQWIAEGAKFEQHWAYKPVVRQEVSGSKFHVSGSKFHVSGSKAQPETLNLKPETQAHPIDTFVRAKLAENGIQPSPEADAITLIKRATYDLHGLPPSLSDLSDASDWSDQKYEALLDRLFASERFGERWGRHWLDMARYADSDGYEKDRPRPDAWRFRDWVIRAINDDMPFDQFTIEQLAGDLLPDATPEQIVATAFNRQTLTNTEGGTDQEQFRVEACMDRTETLGTVWLGLTVGCARCHTHKYDQITQTEYYQLLSYFNNGDEVNKQVPTSPADWAAYEKTNGDAVKKLIPLRKALDAAKAELPVKLPEWERELKARVEKIRSSDLKQTFDPVKISQVTALSKATFKPQPDGSWLASGPLPKTDTYTLSAARVIDPLAAPAAIAALQIEVLPDASLPQKGPGRRENGNFVLSEVSVTADGSPVTILSTTASYSQAKFDAKFVLDGNDQTGWAVGGGTGKAHTLTLHFAQPVAAEARLSVRLVQNYAQANHVMGRFRLLSSSVESADAILPPEIAKILSEEPKRRNPVVIQPLYDFMAKVDPEVVAAERALKQAEAKLPKPPLMDVRVIAQRTNNPRKTHLLHRGDFLQPADEVTPGALSTLPPLKGASRLDLAKWLVSKNNPLTPRVTVNHFWTRLFGEGLVHTVADFGVRGDPPTHPELLDWLADEFMKQGWSRKKILKTIMMSATYRQSSAQFSVLSSQKTEHSRSPEEIARIQEIDPKNYLLWRQNRLRVEGEIVRDLYLGASGLLSAKIGGPSVYPPIPEGIDALSYAGNFKWTTSKGEDRYRRGMYTFFKRTAPHPDLTTFDCPDANTTNVRRTVSNTPLQALTTLNAEAFSEAAQALAKRVLSDASLKDDKARLTQAFRYCVARVPTAGELGSMQKLLDESRYTYQNGPADEAKAAFGTHGVANIAAAENAAWVALSRIVLNLDELITRE